MPDHLHFLCQGKDVNSDLHQLIKSFKQITGFRYKQKFQKTLWQRRYNDHVLRKDEDIKNVVKYILGNPVRKELVKDFKDYPYSDSLVFKLDELMF